MITAADLTNFGLVGVIGELLNFLFQTSSGIFCLLQQVVLRAKKNSSTIRAPFFCNYSWSSITWREFWFWVIHLISPFLNGGMCTCLIFLSGRKSLVMRVISCCTGWICELEIFKGWHLTLIHVCFFISNQVAKGWSWDLGQNWSKC